MKTPSAPLVSVIVTTKNEEKHIADCLESIKGQTYRNVEVIVVDNKSSDKTKEIAKKYTRLVFDKGPERSAQRNFGFSKSKGKYVLYLDADMILTPTVIEECVSTTEANPKIAGLYIPERIIGEGFWIKVRNFERSFYNATVIDCVRFVSRKAFDKVRGFDETMTGPEDWDFDKKIRKIGQTTIIKSEIMHNEGRLDIRKYLSKKGYYAKAMDKYVRKWGKKDPDVRMQLGAKYRLYGVFVEDGKWKKCVRHPIKLTGMIALRILTGITYLCRKKLRKGDNK
ncbi:MAG: glycosyltransferase family A protein [Candidatus Micrarchaeia archaeon]